jgi:hypothetical protein
VVNSQAELNGRRTKQGITNLLPPWAFFNLAESPPSSSHKSYNRERSQSRSQSRSKSRLASRLRGRSETRPMIEVQASNEQSNIVHGGFHDSLQLLSHPYGQQHIAPASLRLKSEHHRRGFIIDIDELD